MITTRTATHCINPQHILYIRADGSYSKLYTTTGLLRVSLNLKEMLAHASHIDFLFRTHKSWAVNIHHINILQSNENKRQEALLHNGQIIPISYDKKKPLMMLLKQASRASQTKKEQVLNLLLSLPLSERLALIEQAITSPYNKNTAEEILSRQ